MITHIDKATGTTSNVPLSASPYTPPSADADRKRHRVGDGVFDAPGVADKFFMAVRPHIEKGQAGDDGTLPNIRERADPELLRREPLDYKRRNFGGVWSDTFPQGLVVGWHRVGVRIRGDGGSRDGQYRIDIVFVGDRHTRLLISSPTY